MSRAKTYASDAERQRAYRERQKAKRNGATVTLAGTEEDPDLDEFTGVPRHWAKLFGVAEARRLSALARAEGPQAAMAEAEALKIERGKTDAQLLDALVKGWRKEFEPAVVEQLLAIVECGGLDAAGLAASAVRRALDWERSWQALRDWDATMQGHQLKALVKRKDPRVLKFLEECRLC